MKYIETTSHENLLQILINTKEETNLEDIIKFFRAKNKVLKDDSGYKKKLIDPLLHQTNISITQQPKNYY